MGFLKKHYLSNDLSAGFISLYTGKMIMQVAFGVGSLFLPIFLYKVSGLNIKYVILYYALNFLLYVALVAYGAKFLNKFGFREAIKLSVFFGALYYAALYFVTESNFIIPLIWTVVFLLLFRLTYWVPYHVDFAKFTNKKNRGKEFSVLESTRLVISVISPFAFGFLIDAYDFRVMFVMGVIIYLLAGIPYLSLPQTKERFVWGYFETWKHFFAKSNRGIVLAYMADGAESIVGLVIWPIFIWELLEGDILQVGLISTLVVGISVFLQLLLGKYADNIDKGKMLKFGSILYSFGWIAKIFVATTFQIFITATYHNLSKIFIRTPFDVMTYEIAADEGHYVDEFTVLHEMAIGLGCLVMLLIIFVFSSFFSLQWTFFLGALAALAYNFLEPRSVKREL